MTRRIALAILLTVWTTLLLGGVVVYMTTRAVLLADLDAHLLARATSIPELRGDDLAVAHPDDRYIVRSETGRTIARAPAGEATAAQPRIVSANFTTLPGEPRRRTITISTAVAADEADQQPSPVTIVYSGSAEGLDRVLNSLAAALLLLGLVGGAGGAAIAVAVARAALRPVHGVSAVIGDINELHLDRRIEAEKLPPELQPIAGRINEMLKRLEIAFKQRKQFLADAAHELRTPIAALMTTLELAVRRERSAEELRRSVEECLADAQLLKQLTEVLLEHARNERPAHAEPHQRFDASSLLHECSRMLEPLAQARQTTIQRHIEEPLRVVGSPARLRSIVLNLMSNAVEHSPESSHVELEARLERGDLVVRVRDNGPGIAAAHLPHLFEPFYRADMARSHGDSHLGLGLFLVQSHVRAMGGRCEVASEAGRGSEFTVVLPLPTWNDDAAPAGEASTVEKAQAVIGR